jgi:F420-0:gamma-glutamyl ligase
VNITVEHVSKVLEEQNSKLLSTDIVAVTEAIVAKYEGNFASIADIATDIKEKFGDVEIGLVYPMLSRNRFLNILKGVALGAKKVHILLSYPNDEVGNPVMDVERLDDITDKFQNRLVTEKEFREVAGAYKLVFTGVDYVELYKSVGDNIEIYFGNDPREILKITKNILVGEIHNRNKTKARLEKSGAEKVYTLSDILNKSINGSGFNSAYGVLGSNLSTGEVLKLFPNYAPDFVNKLQAQFKEKTGVAPEVMVYGDGAFKDPVCGIWELADPVVSPGHTVRLQGQPLEVKLKFVVDSQQDKSENENKKENKSEMQEALKKAIQEKHDNPDAYREGTTPRVYADLVGSLCDLMGGSGDKGTPVILVRGYFDDYTAE